MLSAAARPASRARSRAAAAAVPCAACLHRRAPARPRPPAAAPSNARQPWLQNRGQASFAQAGQAVEEQPHDDEQDPIAERDDEQRSVDALAELLDAVAEQTPEAETVAGAAGAVGTPQPSTSTSIPTPSSAAAPSPPAGRKPKSITLEDILNPKQNAAPEVADLRAFRPRKFVVPEAASPDSHRLVYQKTWDRAYSSLDRAFKKRQLMDFAGPDGLDVDLTDSRMRTRLPGRKPKHWKSKRLDQMSKRELIYTILVLDFDMTHPDTIPSPRAGSYMLESVPLNDRTLFLLLSPGSPTLPKLVRQLGVTVAYRRNPDSGIVSLILRGNSASVTAAKAEVEAIEETCSTTEFELPAPATTLRPEVYQAISRQAKAFLEPGSEPNKLRASAVLPKGLERTERHLNAVFAADAARKSTALFASVPSNLDTLRYALFPCTPLHPTSAILTGGSSQFARLKSLSIAPTASALDDPAHRAQVELLEWSERMRLERTTRAALYVPPTMSPALRESSVLRALRAPFEKATQDGRPLLEAKQVEVVARFGHVAWPLHRAGNAAGAEEGSTGLGPSFAGQRSFERVADWVSEATKKVQSIFIASPPTGLLASTDVLKPLPNPTSTPFSSLFAPLSGTPEADSATQARLTDVAQGPSLSSSVLRRWTYRPVKLEEGAQLAKRVEVDFGLVDVGAIPQVREMQVTRSEVRIVKENRVDLMVPTGSHDAQFSMSTTDVLKPEDYPLEFDTRALTFHGPVPLRIRIGGRDYLLDTDHFIRRTKISPPVPPAPAAGGALDPQQPQARPESAPLVQERWHSLTRDGSRGIEVVQPVASGLADEIRRAGTWRTGLAEVERRCAAYLGATGTAETGGGGTAPAVREPGRLFGRLSRQ
ncbi:hypothetical protein JCM8202_003242 [Rhodotorula sphaerocarpa]